MAGKEGVWDTTRKEVNNIYVIKSLLLMNSGCGSAQYALRGCVKDQFGGLLWD